MNTNFNKEVRELVASMNDTVREKVSYYAQVTVNIELRNLVEQYCWFSARRLINQSVVEYNAVEF